MSEHEESESQSVSELVGETASYQRIETYLWSFQIQVFQVY